MTTSEPGVAAIGNTFSAAATGAVDATAHEAYAPPDTGTAASSSAFEWSKFPNELLLKVSPSNGAMHCTPGFPWPMDIVVRMPSFFGGGVFRLVLQPFTPGP